MTLRFLLVLLALPSWAFAQSDPHWTTSRIHGSPEPPRPYIAAPIFPSLKIGEVLELGFETNARRWYALEKTGRLVSWKQGNDSATQPDIVANLKEKYPELDYLYGIAFHPQFATNHQVILCYTRGADKPEGTQVSRFTMQQMDPPLLDVASEEVILTWPSGGHNGASMHFGPDGMLYISTGDGKPPSPPDAFNSGQDVSDLLCSILRIDVDHRDPGLTYSIPKDNPFIGQRVDTADHMQKLARPEVWAYGLRNPWKMSFDRPTGRLWCGDVGWEMWEMIHLIERGGNYGWSAMEASQPIRADAPHPPTPIRPPVVSHSHDEAASITGGYTYHGKKFPELANAYLYGDYETGKIWALWHDGKHIVRHEEIADTSVKIVTFGQDAEGEVIFAHWGNPTTLHQLVPNPHAASSQPFPRKLSETGLFSEAVAKQQLAAGVHPFAIHAPMWNDSAVGQRFIAMPQGSTATQVRTDKKTQKIISKVTWPAETVFAKTLTMELEQGKPESAIKVETQVLHYDGEAWNAYSYRWNDAGTDADLVGASGDERKLDLKGPAFPGGKHRETYRFASRAECLRCHNAWSGFTLSFQPQQLIDAQAFVDLGLIDANYLKQSQAVLTDPYSEEAALEARARSWLHTNCAHCHRENGGGSAPLMVNIEMALNEMRALDEKPTRGDFGLADARIITPGNPWKSVLLHRVATSASGHMPAIGPREIDRVGLHVLKDWIATLPPGQGTPSVGLTENAQTPEEALAWVSAQSQVQSPPATIALLAKTSPNAHIRGLLESFLPDDQRIETLGIAIDAKKLLAVKGHPEHGAELLAPTGKGATCLACHFVQGAGRDFGPDLSKVGSRLTKDQILESLLHPSKAIAPGFTAYTAELSDGTTQLGFVIQETPLLVILKTVIGQSLTLPRSQIKSLAPIPTSLMPEALLQSFTSQEAADIITYLSSLK